MKNLSRVLMLLTSIFASNITLAAGVISGIPESIMKSDYSTMHLIYIEFKTPVDEGKCDSGHGVVVLDDNDSAKVALALATTAFATGKTFSCYYDDTCSRITGSNLTFPVCAYYPSLKN